MIADLLRNDLGRVAATGSVQAGPLLEVERLRTVWQLTSTVSARLRPGADLADLFGATFPCGSVTGAPKVAAMRLVADAGALPPRRLLRRGGRRRARAATPASTWPSAPPRWTSRPGRRATAPAGESPGTPTRPRSGTRRSPRPGSSRSEPGLPTLLETMRLEGGRVALLDGHLARLSGSARYLGIPPRPRRGAGADRAEAGDARLRLLVSPDGGVAVERAPLPAPAVEPGPGGLLRRAGGPARSGALPQDHPARALRAAPRRAPRRLRRAPPEPRGGGRPRAPSRTWWPRSTGTGSLRRSTPGCSPASSAAGLLARGEVRERRLLPADLSRARRLWVVNALRGWIEARLVP